MSLFDACWALIAPFLALLVRGAYILSPDGALTAALYCLVAATFSLLAFLAFRIRDQMAHYFSVHDAIDIMKAVLVAELMIFGVLFTITRLEGIPRSTPLIHAFLLISGLIGARMLVRLLYLQSETANVRNGNEDDKGKDQIIIVGANRLSSLFINLLESYAPGEHLVVGVLDARPEMFGRTIAGIRIIGSPQDLKSIIDEFAIHGIRTTRVVVGGDKDFMSEDARNEASNTCEQCNIRLDFVSELIGLQNLSKSPANHEPDSRTEPTVPSPLPGYIQYKRVADLVLALVLLVVLLPVFFIVALFVLIDVGFPVLFWQQRIGKGGRNFLIYKFRTLRIPFDKDGQRISESERLSWIGKWLRRTRLDELPQLLNVLVGDMSLIGPRPLLPEDQPPNSPIRLSVRPGISGWAQVNGGKLLNATDKGALDAWYIMNASPALDLRIMFSTLRILLRGREHAPPPKAATRLVRGGTRSRSSSEAQSHLPRDIATTHRFLPRLDGGAQVAQRK